jgi:hypothetical protein
MPLSFKKICDVDPRVEALRVEVLNANIPEWRFQKHYYHRMSDLVGWDAEPHPDYDNTSSGTYEAVYFGLLGICK